MSTYRFVDRKSPEILEALSTAPIFTLKGFVIARLAKEGETITSIDEKGQKTTKTAKAGDWVVTNPSGEQYLLFEDNFFARFKPTSAPGKFVAKGFIRAIRNPFYEPIEIMTSWGLLQSGGRNCMIADLCDEHGNTAGEPYLIDKYTFAESYKPA